MFKHNKSKITIGIDARFYGPIGKGLGRYTQEVVDNIMKISSVADDASFNYVIFLSKDNFDEFDSTAPNIKKVLLNIKWYSLAEQILLPIYIWREKIDLIHFPHFNIPIFTPTKFVVTIHDLILTHFPTVRATTLSPFIYNLKNIAYRAVIKSAIRRSKKIITVSNFTKNDIISKFKVNPDKIVITYEGVANLSKGRDSLFVAKLDRQETLDQYHIAKNFILYVGNAYPHKNLETLLKVFSRLHIQRPELRLVLVGKKDYFYSKIEEYAHSLNLWQKDNINSPVIFPGYVPDAQLEVLYQEAKAYIFPSLYEGFGLPPLEAMARGCLVLSSDRGSLPEVLGAGAIYFNPEKEDDILKKINLALDDENLKKQVLEEGSRLVKKYDWWECARETLEIYKQCL